MLNRVESPTNLVRSTQSNRQTAPVFHQGCLFISMSPGSVHLFNSRLCEESGAGFWSWEKLELA
ncbi:MAG: hypothetical protein ABIJ65_04070 [Chloroflexota bacterium]